MSSTTAPGDLWAAYATQEARALAALEQLAALGGETLAASAPADRPLLTLLCAEAPRGVRTSLAQRLGEETLEATFLTRPCLTALASLDHHLVLAVLPNLAAQLLTAASGDENQDRDCSVAPHLFWLYGRHDLLALVLPALLALDDWAMTRCAEWFGEIHPYATTEAVPAAEYKRFLDGVDARPFARRVVRTRALAETHRPLWEARQAAVTATAQLERQIRDLGPDPVLSHALTHATADERYLVARLISGQYHSGRDGRDLTAAAAVAGEDFGTLWLPELLTVAARRSHGAARLYRDLRGHFAATGRPDLVELIRQAEGDTYGRHDDEDLVVEVRPQLP